VATFDGKREHYYVVITHPALEHGAIWPRRAALYHEPDCSEVLWDTTQAANPGDRIHLSPAEVRGGLDNGSLRRGCRKCGANVNAQERSK
jgi:hypothetical protein